MSIERRNSREIFAPSEVVHLRQNCFTTIKVFTPGNYYASDLPDIAFEMGLVEQLPPMKGKVEQLPLDYNKHPETKNTESGSQKES
ncbi:hypothetical protein [Mastigocladopsis repens]|uniref:hypothetical protein n=1 Tax=Mastigocladopsis repens TaxID=221287 RepID=UPI00030729C8|nr:hypothetical protein [Mastigocladopsis repens]